MDGYTAVTPPQGALAGQWLYDGSLDEVVEINRHCMDLLVGMSEHPLQTSAAVFDGYASAWREVTEAAREQLAASPCLLADAQFGDEGRWRNAMERDLEVLPANQTPAFVGRGAEDFIRRVLVFGWHLARADRQLARMVLGMSPAVAAQMARLRLRDMDWLAQHRAGWVRPRWELQPRVWRNLLVAAGRAEEDELLHFRARGLQLMAAAALPACRGAPIRPRQSPRSQTLRAPA